MRSFLTQLAGALPIMHGVDPDRAARTLPPYRPYYEHEQLGAPAWTRRPSVWERAIETATGPRPTEPFAFIHRDYHPGNTLWVAGTLAAIVDWTTASWGPPSVDLAHMRANLAMSFGSTPLQSSSTPTAPSPEPPAPSILIGTSGSLSICYRTCPRTTGRSRNSSGSMTSSQTPLRGSSQRPGATHLRPRRGPPRPRRDGDRLVYS